MIRNGNRASLLPRTEVHVAERSDVGSLVERWRWGVLLAGALLIPSWLDAGFGPPVQVTDGSGAATQTATGLDLANNAYISSIVNERILVKIIGPGLNENLPVPASGIGQGDPDFATNARATTYLAFSQLDEQFVGEGREIYLTHNGGGRFATPVRITQNRVEDFAPRLVLGRDGEPHLVWSRRIGEATQVLYWNQKQPIGSETLVGQGEYPALFVDGDNVVHVVYSRNKELWYLTNRSGEFRDEIKVTTTPFDSESSISIGVDGMGNVLVAYQSKNSLYFAVQPPSSGFQTPRLLARGGVLQPRLRVDSESRVAIVYIQEGDIFYIQGQSTELNQPQRAFDEPTPEVESHPSLDVDLSNNLHLSYIQNGEVWYTNNASAPQSDFAGLPTIGEVPLKVRFTDLSSGDIQTRRWDFGDGTTSSQQNPVHVFGASGKYTVSLEVTGPGAVSDRKEREDYIFVQDPYNTLRIPDQTVVPGQEDVWFPVIASHKESIQAFQLMGLYDPNMLQLDRYEMSFTAIKAIGPELFVMNDHGTRFEIGCIFDYDPPYDKPPLPPGTDQTLIHLVFDVANEAPQGASTQISLVNNRELSPILNIFTVDGFTKVPALSPSTVKILVIEPPFPRFFIRGDANGDSAVDITDAILILNFLFLGGTSPSCLDAADISDSGRVDISGPISLLNYLFLGGTRPAVPFPMAGLDPSDDSLPLCTR